MVRFVKINRAQSDMTADETEELGRESDTSGRKLGRPKTGFFNRSQSRGHRLCET